MTSIGSHVKFLIYFILDEPTNNIDIYNLSILANAIKRYKKTVLIISHNEYFINEDGGTSEIRCKILTIRIAISKKQTP